MNHRRVDDLNPAPGVGNDGGHTEQPGDSYWRPCVHWLLTTIQPVLQARTGGWTDPKESLKRICSRPTDGYQLAAELLEVRHTFAHWGPIDFATVRWAFETTQLLLDYIGETAAASAVLRQQRALLQHCSAGDNGGHTAGQPRSEQAIRAALEKILTRALAALIDGRVVEDPDNGVDWKGFAGNPHRLRCNNLLGVVRSISLTGDNANFDVPDPQRWHPFPSQTAAAMVRACSWELRNFPLPGKVSFFGIERELSTTRQILTVLDDRAATEVTALLEELWRGQEEAPAPGAEKVPDVEFATDDRKHAWEAITAAADTDHAGVFEIVAEPATDKSSFIKDLDAYLVKQGFTVFSIGSAENAATFISSLERQLSECRTLKRRYARRIAERLQSSAGDTEQERLSRAVYEIDALASRHRVAFLLDEPQTELVDHLKSQLKYLPRALIVYAHRSDPMLSLEPEVGATVCVFESAEGEADPVITESMEQIRSYRDDFRIDTRNPARTIRRFVDDEARARIDDDNLPSVFDCLWVLGEVRDPDLLAAVVGRENDTDAFTELLAVLHQFAFMVKGKNGGVELHSHISEIARNVDVGPRERRIQRIRRRHSAAADFLEQRIQLTPKADESPWSQWDPVYDPVLALDIHDWLVHIRASLDASSPVPDTLQLRLIRLFLEAFWWYECDVPTEFSENLLGWYGKEVDSSFVWLEPLNRLSKSYVSRFAEESDEDVQAWQNVLKALADLSQCLPATEGDSEDWILIKIITTMLKADAIWGVGDEEMLDEAAALYEKASRDALSLGDEDGKWMALWADLLRAQVLSEIRPDDAAGLIGDIEARANEQPENEIRVELALLYGDLAWEGANRARDGGDLTGSRDEMARALAYYGLGVQRAYIYQVFQEKEMAPSTYTRSLYDRVVKHAWRRFDEVPEPDSDVADTALDRYLVLFDPFWSQVYPDGDVAVGSRKWLFPPAPSKGDLFRLDTDYAEQVRDMSSRMKDMLERRLDEHIEWPTPIIMRRIRIDDIDPIAERFVEASALGLQETNVGEAKAAVAAALRAGAETCCLAEKNGSVVGFALTSLAPDGCSVRLESLVTLPEYRSRGVTYRLLRAVRKQAAAAGRTRLTTDVFGDDEMAAEMGFELATIYTSAV